MVSDQRIYRVPFCTVTCFWVDCATPHPHPITPLLPTSLSSSFDCMLSKSALSLSCPPPPPTSSLSLMSPSHSLLTACLLDALSVSFLRACMSVCVCVCERERERERERESAIALKYYTPATYNLHAFLVPLIHVRSSWFTNNCKYHQHNLCIAMYLSYLFTVIFKVFPLIYLLLCLFSIFYLSDCLLACLRINWFCACECFVGFFVWGWEGGGFIFVFYFSI